ncbi:MAG: sugar phosphate isomerase/epimerase [Armatimonadetes bacterium]|nr:sugar phosphate isomerase/epimerase [Candidatus Hippobium faecium]
MIGVSSYSFGHYLSDLGVKETIRRAKEMGFDAIEFAELAIQGTKEELIEEAKKYRDWAEEIGIIINNYATVGDMTHYFGGATTIEEEIKRLQDRVDVAEALGCDKMRHDIAWEYNGGRSLINFFEALPIYANAAREITKYAQQKGIKTMFENHGFFVQKADRVEALLETVNHPNFGLLLDMGNFVCADDNNLNSVKKLAKYAFHCHAKDFYMKDYTEPDEEGWFRSDGGTLLQGCALEEGKIRPVKCMEILKDCGYKGDLSLEYEGDGDNLEGIAKGYKILRENWN